MVQCALGCAWRPGRNARDSHLVMGRMVPNGSCLRKGSFAPWTPNWRSPCLARHAGQPAPAFHNGNAEESARDAQKPCRTDAPPCAAGFLGDDCHSSESDYQADERRSGLIDPIKLLRRWSVLDPHANVIAMDRHCWRSEICPRH